VSVFLGLLPQGDALEALRAHERPATSGIRWEPERRWHITLRYFAHDDEATVDVLRETADELGQHFSTCRLSLGPRTQRLGRDGTLVVPVRGAETLAAAVDESLGGMLGEREEDFFGHLTLARLRRPHALAADLIGVALEAHFEVNSLVLIRSTPGPEGSEYEVLHTAALARAL